MSRTVFFVLSILIFMASGAVAEIATFDNFNDNVTNTNLWTACIDEEGGVTVAETNGRLEISIAATANGITFGGGYESQMKLSGDFDLQVDYELLEWPYANGVRVGLGVSPMNSAYLVERISFGNPSTGDYPYAHSRDNYLSDSSVAGVVFGTTDDLSGTLRITRTGRLISYYYYGDSDWELISSILATSADVRFSLSAWSHDFVFSDAPVVVAFDNVKLSNANLTPVPEPATITLLAFGVLGLAFLGIQKRRGH